MIYMQIYMFLSILARNWDKNGPLHLCSSTKNSNLAAQKENYK